MKKYPEDFEQSTDILRKAISNMVKHVATLSPICYAVWYDYFSGRNPDLQVAMDEALKSGNRLDDYTVSCLYQAHVCPPQPLNSEIIQRIDGLTEKVSVATDKATQQAGSLLHALDGVNTLSTAEMMDEAIIKLNSEAGVAYKAFGAINSDLERSKLEIQRLQLEIKIAREEALRDPLTGIGNRRLFRRSLDTAVLARTAGIEKNVFLIICDIDNFKSVNDKFGHPFGDQVIRAVAQIIKTISPASAEVARLGGEEFAILIKGSSLEEAKAIAEKIRERVASARIKRHSSLDVVATITISIGLAQHREEEPSGEFFQRADEALYQSKHNGRDRVTVFS